MLENCAESGYIRIEAAPPSGTLPADGKIIMSPYLPKRPFSYQAYRWAVHLLIGVFLLALWFGAVIFFLQQPFILALIVGVAAVALAVLCTHKRFRLRRDLRKLEKDPVNPDLHFLVARDWYMHSLFLRSRHDKLESLRAFRNAVQLDLNLDIRKPGGVIAAFVSRHGSGRAVVRFTRVMALYATIDFLFEEYERRGLPAGDLFLGRNKLLQFDPRRLRYLISAYELRLAELEAYSYHVEKDILVSGDYTAMAGDVFAARRRQVDMLISFHREMLEPLRRLYREYQFF